MNRACLGTHQVDLVVVILLTLTSVVYAPVPTPIPVVGYKSNEPIRNSLRAISYSRASAEKLVGVLTNMLERGDPSYQPPRCNLRDENWGSVIRTTLKERGFGELNLTCQSWGTSQNSEALDVSKALHNFATTVERAASSAKLFPSSYALTDWQFRTDNDRCNLVRGFTLRRNNRWYLLAGVTNVKPQIQFTKNRSLIYEFVDASLRAPSLKMLVYNKKENKNESFTTLRVQEQGAVPIASFYTMPYRENPAVAEAIERNDHHVQQAEDSLMPSNVAILAFPLVLSIIPLALFADVHAPVALFYVVFTDVISAVPVIVKGVELLIAGTRVEAERATWTTGDDNMRIVETWVVDCTGLDTFTGKGIAFVTAGIAVVVFGCVLEYLAARYMKRRREAGILTAPFGNNIVYLHPHDADPNTLTPDYRADLPPSWQHDVPAPPPPSARPGVLNGIKTVYRRLAGKNN